MSTILDWANACGCKRNSKMSNQIDVKKNLSKRLNSNTQKGKEKLRKKVVHYD